MEILYSLLFTIFKILLVSVILAIPVLNFMKTGAVKKEIEGDANIFRYILTGCENSAACNDFLLKNGTEIPLTKSNLKNLKKSDPEKFDLLIEGLNHIINKERIKQIEITQSF